MSQNHLSSPNDGGMTCLESVQIFITYNYMSIWAGEFRVIYRGSLRVKPNEDISDFNKTARKGSIIWQLLSWRTKNGPMSYMYQSLACYGLL